LRRHSFQNRQQRSRTDDAFHHDGGEKKAGNYSKHRRSAERISQSTAEIRQLVTQLRKSTWLIADITTAKFPHHHFDVWHDRAVFHFLTDPKDRELYIKNVLHSVKPGGHVIVATFSLNGPAKCSGVEVVRYNPETLHGEFGENFDLIDHVEEKHKTPFGTEQQFIYCFCKKA